MIHLPTFVNPRDHTHMHTRIDFHVEMNEFIRVRRHSFVTDRCVNREQKRNEKIAADTKSDDKQTGEIFGEDRQHRLFIQAEDYHVHNQAGFSRNERA